jgi:hypothetical protein
MRSILWLPLIAGLWLAGCDEREVPVTTLPAPEPAQEEALVPPPVKAPPVKLPAPLRKPQQPVSGQVATATTGDQPGPGGDVAPPDGAVAADSATRPLGDAGPSQPSPDSSDAMLQNPDEVIGLDLAQIARLLGEPAFRTEQPPAKVWSYAGAGCAMRVFVYPDIKSRVFRALTYEIQGTDGTLLAKRRCFTGLKKQHAA